MFGPDSAAPARLDRLTLLTRAAGVGAGVLLGERLVLQGASAATGREEVQRFASRPDLIPPKLTVVQRAGRAAPGLLFLGPSSGPGQRGAMIVDDSGELVWFHPTVPKTVINFRAALYHGQPVLTWWEGKTKHGLGIGEHVVFDRTYREIARFPAGGGLESDLHELILTPSGTALVTAYDIPTVDRSSVGGGRGRVIEGIVQELEVPSARVLFEWRSLDHVKLTESHSKVAPSFDFFHVNSIDLDADDNLLVSARNTWTVYKIDRGNGKVIWRLGGKRSDFAMGPGTKFAWQHDARHRGSENRGDGSLMTLFDNEDGPQVQPQSRGLTLSLDFAHMRATLVHAYVHRPKMLAHAFGSVQTQANGNVLVGWGTESYFTEYTADGTVVLDAKLPHGGQNYRTLRFPWAATPAEPPRLAMQPGASGSALYASWNGATGVHAWQVLVGPSAGALVARSTTPRTGFETVLPRPTGDAFAAAEALDASGRPLGRSAVLKL
jgi:Arylsulfotransferase (ASST)